LISITFFCIPYLFFKNEVKKDKFIFLSIFLIFCLGNYFYGSFKINNKKYEFDENIYIKIVSPNFSLQDYNNQSEITQLNRLIKISDPEKDKKTIFIWPEGIFYESYLQDIDQYKKLFTENFSENHLIVLGINNFVFSSDAEDEKYFNSLVVLNHELEILAKYNKIYLVPFGEFLPLQEILSKYGFKKITKGYNSFSAGDKRKIINLNSHFNDRLILPLICYEIIYSGEVKKKNQFPDLVINISEDAWFGKSIGPYQHYTKAIYRSVEEGVFIARSANKGISGFINPNGESIKFLNMSESGNIEYKMPHFDESTLFSNYGNKIFFLIVLVYIFMILILRKFKI